MFAGLRSITTAPARRCFASLAQAESSTSRQRLDTLPLAVDTELPPNMTFEDGDVRAADRIVDRIEEGARYYSDAIPLTSLAATSPHDPPTGALAVPVPETVLNQPFRRDILHRCVVFYLSLLRQGTTSTKTRAEVRASGRKLIRQKGSGRARVGDAGSGIRRGGGVIHGPKPRDFAQKLPRKVQQLGLHVALSCRLRSGLLRLVPALDEAAWTSTREASRALLDSKPGQAWANAVSDLEEPVPEADEQDVGATSGADAGITRFGTSKTLSVLFVHHPASPLADFYRTTRNIPGIDVVPVDELAAYDVLRRKWTVMDTAALEWLAERAGDVPDIMEQMEQGQAELEEVAVQA